MERDVCAVYPGLELAPGLTKHSILFYNHYSVYYFHSLQSPVTVALPLFPRWNAMCFWSTRVSSRAPVLNNYGIFFYGHYSMCCFHSYNQ